MIRKLWNYREYWGNRIAWKIGNLDAEEPYGRPPGTLQISLDINSDTHAFYAPDAPDAYPRSHDFCVVFWRWGIWVAVRACL